MHPISHVIWAGAAMTLVLGTLVNAQPAEAAPEVRCNPFDKTCEVRVRDGGRSGGTRQIADTEAHKGRNTSQGGSEPRLPRIADLCHTLVARPQPPASDLVWAGREPGSGTVYVRTCPYTRDSEPTSTLVWVANGEDPPAAPVVTPEELAQEALASLKVPRPRMRRSPDGDSWVQVWTWFWASPATWKPKSATASVGRVWARVTATPVSMVIDPGDGSGSVPCPGPGRAWTEADGDAAPFSRGGCGVRYRHVSADGSVTARVSIRWRVAWTGSGGAGGVLPGMTTSSASSFVVRQIQAVQIPGGQNAAERGGTP